METVLHRVEKKTRKRQWWKIIKSHFLRVSLVVLSYSINFDGIFRLIGLVNRRIGLIESIFLAYPADKKYALAYTYPYWISRIQWDPRPCGLLWQNRKICLMFCITATNGQFTDPANGENLRQLSERMEKLRQLFGAKRKSFAGILPGILYRKRIISDAPEADLTAVAILKAIDLVKTQESLESDIAIVVLGGQGFIGQRVVKLLNNSNACSIDSADSQDINDWPNHLYGKRIIVLNITLANSMNNYLAAFWPGTVILNEVYPEPQPDILQKIAAKECCCYHVVGVRATAFPSFPSAYQGAIPCCAAWPSSEMTVVVRKLV